MYYCRLRAHIISFITMYTCNEPARIIMRYRIVIADCRIYHLLRVFAVETTTSVSRTRRDEQSLVVLLLLLLHHTIVRNLHYDSFRRAVIAAVVSALLLQYTM